MRLFYLPRFDFYKSVWRGQFLSDVSARRVKARGVSEKTRKGGPPPESVELGSTEPPGEVIAHTAWVNLPLRLGPTQHWSMKECEFSDTHFEFKTSLL